MGSHPSGVGLVKHSNSGCDLATHLDHLLPKVTLVHKRAEPSHSVPHSCTVAPASACSPVSLPVAACWLRSTGSLWGWDRRYQADSEGKQPQQSFPLLLGFIGQWHPPAAAASSCCQSPMPCTGSHHLLRLHNGILFLQPHYAAKSSCLGDLEEETALLVCFRTPQLNILGF